MTVAWWISPDLFSSSTTLEAAVTGSLEVLKFLIFRGPLAPHETTASMLTTLRAWKVGPCPPREGFDGDVIFLHCVMMPGTFLLDP